MDRKTQREMAFKAIYMMVINNDYSIELAGNYIAENELASNKVNYYMELTTCFIDNRNVIDNIMNQIRDDYPLSKLPLVDISLIKLAVTEIYLLHEPLQIVINEVVELSKIYSDENNYKFINSFLGTLVRSMDA